MRVLARSLGAAFVLTMTAAPTMAVAQVFQPGTQPVGHDGGIVTAVQTSGTCARCHGGYVADAESEPFDGWRGSMMANAARDPVFRAALSIAEEDSPAAADFCVRCHSMPAWLRGRSSEPDYDTASSMPRFLPDEDGVATTDLDGVACMVCHRSDDPSAQVPTLGNAQLVLADGARAEARQGPYDYAAGEDPRHPTELSAFVSGSRLCGQCHDIVNPLVGGHRADGTSTGRPFVIERTFSEWRESAFGDRDETCQSCHLAETSGAAAMGFTVREHLSQHDLTGGSVWQPLAIAAALPGASPTTLASYRAASERAGATLRRAADVAIEDAALVGGSASFGVRVTNRTGHKLPTGYPEGRRMWLEVTLRDAAGRTLATSGRLDPATGILQGDSQERTYEVKLGERATPGAASFHFIRNDVTLSDTRIPPEGFRAPADLDMAPSGRDYLDADGHYRHDDLAPYVYADLCGDGALTIEARLRYQSNTAEYMQFLRDESPSSLDPALGGRSHGQLAYEAWQAHGGDEPTDIATVSMTLSTTLTPCPDAAVPADAAVVVDAAATLDAAMLADGASADAGPVDAAPMDAGGEGAGGGCGCRVTGGASDAPSAGRVAALAALLVLAVRRRRR